MSDEREKQLRVVFLMPQNHADASLYFAHEAGVKLKGQCAQTLGELRSAVEEGCDLIVAFCTSVIVPEEILLIPGLRAINVHGALPAFPGRDPHHFAHYARAHEYGATLHYMAASVDSGPIIEIESFLVRPDMTPSELLQEATAAGLALIQRFFQVLATGVWPTPSSTLSWGKFKTTRKDFVNLCKIDPAISRDEFERRRLATSMPGYSNLYIEMYGYRFRLDGKVE